MTISNLQSVSHFNLPELWNLLLWDVLYPFTRVKRKGVNTLSIQLSTNSVERVISEQRWCSQSLSHGGNFKWIKTYEMRGFENNYNQRDISNNLFWLLRHLWRVGLDQDLWKYRETISHRKKQWREIAIPFFSLQNKMFQINRLFHIPKERRSHRCRHIEFCTLPLKVKNFNLVTFWATGLCSHMLEHINMQKALKKI